MHRTDVLRAKAIKHGKLTAIQNHFSVTSWLINKTVFCCCTYSQNSEDTSTFKSQPQGIYINLEGDHVAVTLYACYVCRSTQILSVFRSSTLKKASNWNLLLYWEVPNVSSDSSFLCPANFRSKMSYIPSGPFPVGVCDIEFFNKNLANDNNSGISPRSVFLLGCTGSFLLLRHG